MELENKISISTLSGVYCVGCIKVSYYTIVVVFPPSLTARYLLLIYACRWQYISNVGSNVTQYCHLRKGFDADLET